MGSWGLHEYGKLYDTWPRSPEGEPEQSVFLTHCSPLDMEADMLRSMLESYGIPSIRRAPGDGAFGEVILGMSGNGVDIYVPASMAEDAEALLKGEPDDELSEGI